MNANSYKDIIVILMAAGKSTRFSKETNNLKQFYLLNDKPLYRYSLDFFLHFDFSKILLILPQEYLKNFDNSENNNKKIAYVAGGNTRTESVYNAILYILKNKLKLTKCIIHDVARPFIDEDILDNIMTYIYEHDSITCAINPSDTVGFGNQYIDTYLDRNFTYLIQTPQAFSFDILKECYDKYLNEKGEKIFTDDTSLVYEYTGIKPKIIKGKKNLFKITDFEDLKYAKFLLKNEKIEK